MIEANLTHPLGEVDLLATAGTDLVVVEVKTITDIDGAPLERIDAAKAHRLWAIAREIGAHRVEYVGIRLTTQGVRVEWLPG